MRLVYLSSLGEDTADHMRKLEAAGYEVLRVEKIEDAQILLETDNADVLVFTWVYEGQLKYIKKKFITICQDPRVSFNKFLEDLKCYRVNQGASVGCPRSCVWRVCQRDRCATL